MLSTYVNIALRSSHLGVLLMLVNLRSPAGGSAVLGMQERRNPVKLICGQKQC